MVDSLIDLKQYAIAGASISILIAGVFIILFLKASAKREAKREAKYKKKEAHKEIKSNQKSNEKRPNPSEERRQQIEEVNLPKETVQQIEIVNLPKETVQQIEIVNLPKETVQQIEIINLPEEKVQQVEIVNLPNEKAQQVEIVSLADEKVQQAEEIEEVSPMILYFYKVHSMKKEDNKKLVLENSITIGRNVGYNQWVITDDRTVSGKHCKIYQRNNELYMIDLDSTNGTYVNDRRVRGEIKLVNHDKIRIGQSEYRIKF